MNKVDNEKFIFTFFQNHYVNFPVGTIIQDDKPDFTVENENRKIGIEVGEVFQDLHLDKGSRLKRKEVEENNFGNLFIKAVEKYTSKPFALGIMFCEPSTFKRKQIQSIINDWLPKSLEFIMNHSKGLIKIDNTHEDIPTVIKSIYIQLLSDDMESFYDESQVGWVADLELKHIKGIISNHEESLSKYKPCDEYWLLIREGNYHAGSFKYINIETPIDTKFDKVFIVRTSESEIVCLK